MLVLVKICFILANFLLKVDKHAVLTLFILNLSSDFFTFNVPVVEVFLCVLYSGDFCSTGMSLQERLNAMRDMEGTMEYKASSTIDEEEEELWNSTSPDDDDNSRGRNNAKQGGKESASEEQNSSSKKRPRSDSKSPPPASKRIHTSPG